MWGRLAAIVHRMGGLALTEKEILEQSLKGERKKAVASLETGGPSSREGPGAGAAECPLRPGKEVMWLAWHGQVRGGREGWQADSLPATSGLGLSLG